MTQPALTVLDGVRWQGAEVVGARSQRLLAVLATVAPHAVSAGRLVEHVWSDDLPEHPEKALQVLVSRDSDVDAMELSRLVGEARAAAAAGELDLARVCAEAALAITVGGAGDEVTRDLVAEANGQVVVCGHAEERGSGRFQGSFTGGARGFTAPVVVAIR